MQSLKVTGLVLETIWHGACRSFRVRKEFAFVPEEHAPGAAKLRKAIVTQLKGKSANPIREELHDVLLKEVGELSAEYTVVVFKTTGVIPYSSVFFTLDCGYWSGEAEAAMRKKMEEVGESQ